MIFHFINIILYYILRDAPFWDWQLALEILCCSAVQHRASWFCALSQVHSYFRLHNRASGPEIFYFWGLHGPLLPQIPLEKAGGFAPPLFPVGFAVRGPFGPQI